MTGSVPDVAQGLSYRVHQRVVRTVSRIRGLVPAAGPLAFRGAFVCVWRRARRLWGLVSQKAETVE